MLTLELQEKSIERPYNVKLINNNDNNNNNNNNNNDNNNNNNNIIITTIKIRRTVIILKIVITMIRKIMMMKLTNYNFSDDKAKIAIMLKTSKKNKKNSDVLILRKYYKNKNKFTVVNS